MSKVIGIDLGMALIAIENYRSGLIWKLMASHPSTGRALTAAGLRKTTEKTPRRVRIAPSRHDTKPPSSLTPV